MRSNRSSRVDDEDGPDDSSPPHDPTQLMEQLRKIADLQRHLLPRELPQPAGWRIAAYYSVGPCPSGDYYDFMTLPDGRIDMVVNDPRHRRHSTGRRHASRG